MDISVIRFLNIFIMIVTYEPPSAPVRRMTILFVIIIIIYTHMCNIQIQRETQGGSLK